MRRSQSRKVGAVGAIAVALGIVGAAVAQAPAPPPTPPARKAPAAPAAAVEPKASQTLKRMSDFLGSQQAFSLSTEHMTQVVDQSGQKLDFVADSTLVVQRPNKLRSDRVGEGMDLSLYYDGSALTLYGRRMNTYATADAPATLDETIDFARQELELEAPAADLLYGKPYDVLMEDVVSGTYVGQTTLDGKKCHHLAFRGNETDWQIWIEDGARPVPLRFVIVSKKVAGAPEFAVSLKSWNFRPRITPELFTFTPPPNAEQIDFFRHGVGEKTSQLQETP
jgi:hypothetical protein